MSFRCKPCRCFELIDKNTYEVLFSMDMDIRAYVKDVLPREKKREIER